MTLTKTTEKLTEARARALWAWALPWTSSQDCSLFALSHVLVLALLQVRCEGLSRGLADCRGRALPDIFARRLDS